MPIKERLKLCAGILVSIDERRKCSGDHSMFSSLECQLVDRELRELADERILNPESPAVADIWRIR